MRSFLDLWKEWWRLWRYDHFVFLGNVWQLMTSEKKGWLILLKNTLVVWFFSWHQYYSMLKSRLLLGFSCLVYFWLVSKVSTKSSYFSLHILCFVFSRILGKFISCAFWHSKSTLFGTMYTSTESVAKPIKWGFSHELLKLWKLY